MTFVVNASDEKGVPEAVEVTTDEPGESMSGKKADVGVVVPPFHPLHPVHCTPPARRAPHACSHLPVPLVSVVPVDPAA